MPHLREKLLVGGGQAVLVSCDFKRNRSCHFVGMLHYSIQINLEGRCMIFLINIICFEDFF